MVQISSRVPPGSKETFFDNQTPPEQLQYFFSKFEVCSSKWVFGFLFQTSSINTLWWPSVNLTCFSIFLFSSKMTRRAKYGTIHIQLSVIRICDTRLSFEKKSFFDLFMWENLQNQAKIASKMLEKKMQKKSKNFFLPKCPQSNVDGPK